ncbi:PREDICTED: polyadenylate-binding protein RBP47C-like [Camelina sativa]|uniref:Polyadenylate-binding protein RBP47C-like n=1 Tax=Camelina sativa TaxID=90675 RepID=A0ABM1RL03_CAMSA|nr:PREDICTED: polyadenylate-binding protein RBP47C-like [Camelina sativa]
MFFWLISYCIDHDVWYEDYLLRESFPIEEEETPPDFVETLFLANLSPQTKISHIISFFEDVEVEVVSVRLIVNPEGKHVGYGFVEFAYAYEAKKALKKKNGRYLHDRKISLHLAKIAPYSPRPKYNLVEKLWYEDYLRQESLLIEEDEAVEGLDETPNFVEEVAVRKRTLFISNLSLKTKIPDIINFFGDVGEVLSVRLIVNSWGKRVGCGFVEFASANKAKEALQKKNGGKLQRHYISLDVAEIAPYPLRPKNEDCLRRESLMIEEADWQTKPNRKMKLYGVHKKRMFFTPLSRCSLIVVMKA